MCRNPDFRDREERRALHRSGPGGIQCDDFTFLALRSDFSGLKKVKSGAAHPAGAAEDFELQPQPVQILLNYFDAPLVPVLVRVEVLLARTFLAVALRPCFSCAAVGFISWVVFGLAELLEAAGTATGFTVRTGAMDLVCALDGGVLVEVAAESAAKAAAGRARATTRAVITLRIWGSFSV
jgi:hypothetical protein